ncbi:MAG: hypothetical protein HKO53_11095 [Gemmatimonadetes bacterium]|nr:hypothetical protein [Gemmatimonadota bacterium]NNM33604.1 hypothetical protein [Gemmatimonadota bacterium]
MSRLLTMSTVGRVAAAVMVTALSTTAVSGQSHQAENPAALEQQAEAYLDEMDRWGRAADLYRQAAELRDPADPVAVSNLKTAARLEFYNGSERQALRDLQYAGQRALAIGDVVSAANAFVDAAWVAGSDGQGQEARAMIERAQLLVLSPLISTEDRTEIQRRLPVTGS